MCVFATCVCWFVLHVGGGVRFYGGLLKSHPDNKRQARPQGFPWPHPVSHTPHLLPRAPSQPLEALTLCLYVCVRLC